ncbi:MAG: biopolymer transporter ExbD [Myxococcota bacterium]|nr:biopolymer transporter ExbD [Myxococcota bacterium]
MKAPSSHLGFGLYFIDVLACSLFCITLALVSARFGRETAVAVELPRAESAAREGASLDAEPITVRTGESGPELYWGSERLTHEQLAQRLRAAPPPAVVVRSEASPLARVIAAAHAAGVYDIQLAYRPEEETR